MPNNAFAYKNVHEDGPCEKGGITAQSITEMFREGRKNPYYANHKVREEVQDVLSQKPISENIRLRLDLWLRLLEGLDPLMSYIGCNLTGFKNTVRVMNDSLRHLASIADQSKKRESLLAIMRRTPMSDINIFFCELQVMKDCTDYQSEISEIMLSEFIEIQRILDTDPSQK